MMRARASAETVITCVAIRMDLGTFDLNTRRSRSENHSGLVTKQMSCTVSTTGAADQIGAA